VVRGAVGVQSLFVGALGLGVVHRLVLAPPNVGLIRGRVRQQRFAHSAIVTGGLIRVRRGSTPV
jgi:hypothetical protein